MNNKNSVLGKGLSALFDEEDPISSEKKTNNKKSNNVVEIDCSDIIAGKFQPRKKFDEEAISELKDSIKENGVIQPIIVRKLDNGKAAFEIIAGERRWRASKSLNIKKIPVVIKELDDNKALEIAIIENIQRQSLSTIEEAEGYKKLQTQFNYSQEELANKLGKSRSHVSNMLRVLTLPENIKSLIDESQLTIGHAKMLVNFNESIRNKIIEKVIDNQLSVRQTEKLCANIRSKVSENKKKQELEQGKVSELNEEKNSDIAELERAISGKLGLKVEINENKEKSTVVISYENLSQLDKILHKLS